MTIGAIVDVQKGANINIITNLEYERVKYLVQNMGYNIAGAKKRALTEVLWAFHIMDIKGSAEQLDIVQGGDANGALLAISIMIQGVAGTEFNVVDMMKDFREDLKGDGQWTGKTARTKIADIAYAADSAGKFPVYRKNVEGWALSDTVPFFESYINDFWGSEFGIGKCSANRFGEIKKNDTVWYATHYSQSGFSYPGNRGAQKMYRWRHIGQFEYNTRNNVCNVEGLVIPGNIDKDKHYMCAKEYWDLEWREATDLEVDMYYTECSPDGKLHKFSDGYTYKCSNDEFIKATALDTALGKGCVSYLEGREFEFDNAIHTYTCENGSWSMNDTWSKGNCAKDGSIQALLNGQNTQKKGYVCDADTFRVATKADSADVTAVGAVCVGYLEGQINKTDFFSCLDRRWIASPKTFTDTRDGKTYKYIQIGSQKWMAENLNYRYLGPTIDEDSSSFCYNNYSANCDVYGRLYLWSAAMDSAGIIKGNVANGCGFGSECTLSGTIRGVCPEGWHLPDTTEWKILFDAVGGRDVAGKMLKSTSGWDKTGGWDNHDGNGMDTYSFSVLPAGERDIHITYRYHYMGLYGEFWSLPQSTFQDAYHVNLSYSGDGSGFGYSVTIKYYSFSVRCLKD